MLLDLCPFQHAFERKAMPRRDETPQPQRARRVRRTAGDRVLHAVMDLAGTGAELVSHAEVPWASVTFSGARHTIVLHFQGWEACDNAEHLITALPEHEFRVAGVLVADAAVARVEQDLLPEPRMDVELELLLLDDQ